MDLYSKSSGIDNLRDAFPADVLRQAAVASGIRPSSFLSKRLDLRGKTILSFGEIEDKHCECAVSIQRENGGNWLLGLHVPDVAEYVCEGSPLDEEAKERCGAIRNGLLNVDMLPPAITYDVCDLKVGKDRLALSVMMSINPDGDLLDVSFDETVIRVAENCLYTEIDRLGLAHDISSVYALRDKYSPYMNIILDMYELAALLFVKRRERGGLDCAVFRRLFKRGNDGEMEFKFAQEPDSRAMVRELGYFAAEAIGKFMKSHSLPCIFVGQDTLADNVLDFLDSLVGVQDKTNEGYIRTSNIAEIAKGSPYYGFICAVIRRALPCARFSDKPIFNSTAAADCLVSFVHPVTKYSSLLTLRMIKTCILASGDPKNININKYRKLAIAASESANASEEFVYVTQKHYFKVLADEYIENNVDKYFVGFPTEIHESGSVAVMLLCGVNAVVPSEFAKDYKFVVGVPCDFEIVALGTEEEPVIVKVK